MEDGAEGTQVLEDVQGPPLHQVLHADMPGRP